MQRMVQRQRRRVSLHCDSALCRANPHIDGRVNRHVGGARRRLRAHEVHEGARRSHGAYLLWPAMRRSRNIRQPRERARQGSLHSLHSRWRDGAQDTVERRDVLAPHLSKPRSARVTARWVVCLHPQPNLLSTYTDLTPHPHGRVAPIDSLFEGHSFAFEQEHGNAACISKAGRVLKLIQLRTRVLPREEAADALGRKKARVKDTVVARWVTGHQNSSSPGLRQRQDLSTVTCSRARARASSDCCRRRPTCPGNIVTAIARAKDTGWGTCRDTSMGRDGGRGRGMDRGRGRGRGFRWVPWR